MISHEKSLGIKNLLPQYLGTMGLWDHWVRLPKEALPGIKWICPKNRLCQDLADHDIFFYPIKISWYNPAYLDNPKIHQQWSFGFNLQITLEVSTMGTFCWQNCGFHQQKQESCSGWKQTGKHVFFHPKMCMSQELALKPLLKIMISTHGRQPTTHC